ASDPSYHRGTNTLLVVQKAINAADPLHPTAAEDANDPNNPRLLLVGTPVVWSYLLTNPGLVPLTINSFKDDGGSPGFTGDDFSPTLVSGDGNNNILDRGETVLYKPIGVNYQVQPGLYGNVATAHATGTNGQPVTASDPTRRFAEPTVLVLKKSINAADPLHPTPAEDANDPNN